MFDQFIVPPLPEIDPGLPGYRRFLLRHKRVLQSIFQLGWSLSLMALSIYYLLFRIK